LFHEVWKIFFRVVFVGCENETAVSSHLLVVCLFKSLSTTEAEILLKNEFEAMLAKDLEYALKKTIGFYYEEMKTLVEFVKQETSANGGQMFSHCFDKALKRYERNRKFKQQNRLNIDTTDWNDIGGLSEIKNIIMDTILLPLNHPSLFTSTDERLGISRSGILLYGPPGEWKKLFIFRFYLKYQYRNKFCYS
jgi:SpoVK/Ycf46/Vps4 family AAA+-type ATPase